MTELLAQFHELPAVSLAAFGVVAAAGMLMGAAPSPLPGRSVPADRSAVQPGAIGGRDG